MSVFISARVFNAIAVSGTTAYTTAVQKVNCVRDCSYQLSWSGTPTGTFVVWVSNVETPDTTTDVDWCPLSLAIPIVQPAGAAGKDLVDLASLPFKHVRLRYTNASSTGTVTADFCGKGL